MKLTLRKQQGVTIVEFTVVSTVLLVLLFGIIEIAQFLFSLQMLNEMTRRAARLASVCYIVDDSKLNVSDFGSTFNVPLDLSSLVLEIDYLDDSGNVVNNATTDAGFANIRYVQARVSGFSFSFTALGNILGAISDIDSFETTIPSESLGVYRPYWADDGTFEDAPSKMDCQS